MTDHMAANGTLVDMKFMKTSGSLRVVIEIPKEMANAAHTRLGGYPDPAVSRHVALAILDLTQTADSIPNCPTG